ncbi:MAG TPA: aspartyl/asparaginyl beta-hydroxylase domain-containing protein [Bacteroidia bacterium]|jgi:aspartyl/asparaginyl beta-hydroxylase (cupin superfamily)|nr:aspartyl/asparaginyl beta-hydroxylase domain-containing protein [Bacteroidia bacterium]
MSELWYASGKEKYKENEPCFFDSDDYAWATDIKKYWSTIKEEVRKLIEEQDKKFTSNSYLGIATNNGWSSLSYLFWGSRIPGKDLKTQCSQLANYLEGIPGIVSVSFSRLAPQTTIKEHRGDTNAVLRCHLGIEIPAGLPDCGIRVGGEEKSWKEGEWLFFNDAHKHMAWNNTDKRRIVLIVDVVRPEFLNKQKNICATIRTRHIIFHLGKKSKLINTAPGFIKSFLFNSLYLLVYTVKALRNSSL